MFSVFDEVIENAIGIEVHNRNDEGYKPDVTLNNVYVLMSAFEDGDSIIPVKLEVKEFKDKQNTLYIAISLEAIKKTEVLKQGNTEKGVTQNSYSVTISICDLFSKINPKDINFLKYIPNNFLNTKQLAAKNKAIGAVKNSDRDALGSIESNQALKKEGITGEKSANKTSNNVQEMARENFNVKYYQELIDDLPFDEYNILTTKKTIKVNPEFNKGFNKQPYGKTAGE